ncbi:MAG: L,D-transpeptidase [Ramlibacter sp.]|nr:L,D-transpeptidase [Ramlibacter sp.]
MHAPTTVTNNTRRRQILISARDQTLILRGPDSATRRYSVSTAGNGSGELEGSGCTPRGRHFVRAKIGAGRPEGAVFAGRRETGEIYTETLARTHPQRDWILTRLLWLCGREPGKNRFGAVDTMRRYIYIHGCPDALPMGVPLSHGCVRMRNKDIVELFDLVEVGCEVLIHE